MKKTYSKPEIMFESFVMNTHIAACVEEAESQYMVCGVYFAPGITLFSDGISGCSWKDTSAQDDPHDSVCYHNPTEDAKLFGS